MICFEEQQKKDIGRAVLLVIEFNEAVKKVFEFVKDMLLQLADRVSKSLQMIHQKYQELSPKEKYKMVHKLDKCGFTEKEINLMIGGAHHCRNNC